MNRVYRGLPLASPHKSCGSWLPAGGSSCRSVCGGSASFCLAAAGPSASPPTQQQYVGSCCSGRGWTASQDPARHLRMPSHVCRACRQMLMHRAAGRDPAASGQGLRLVPDAAQPWPMGEGRRGGIVHECCCLFPGCAAKSLTCCGPCLRPSTARHDPSDLRARAGHGAPRRAQHRWARVTGQ